MEEARKRAESAEGRIREEMALRECAESEVRKAAKDFQEAREVADAANAAHVSAESNVDTLRAAVVNMR